MRNVSFNKLYVGGCSDSSTGTDNVNNNVPPNQPANPIPANGDTLISRMPQLSWSCTDPENDTLGYVILIDTDSMLTSGDQLTTTSQPLYSYTSYLEFHTTYYWQIIAHDYKHNNSTAGPVWHFTTIPFDSTYVNIPDTSFRRAIVSHVSTLGPNDSIYVSDVDTITSLVRIGGNTQSGDYHISSIEGIQHLASLHVLYLYEFPSLSDISPLQGLTALTDLSINYDSISDLSPLQNLTNLSSLNFANNHVSDISALQNMTSMRSLWMYRNQVADISSLSGMSNLQTLEASENQISDIDVLGHLDKLQILSLSDNQITNVDSLAHLDSLTSLALGRNQIVDISALQYLPSIRLLFLENNQIVDIKPLVNNAGLGTNDQLHLENNPLSDSSINTFIPQLEARGVTVTH